MLRVVHRLIVSFPIAKTRGFERCVEKEVEARFVVKMTVITQVEAENRQTTIEELK